MKRNLKIALTGTHHTGKSTFIADFVAELAHRGVPCARVGDLAVEARDKGFPILREHTFESTAWIISRGITLELEAGRKANIVVVDRPVSDALGYLTAALRYRNAVLPQAESAYLEGVVNLHSSTYDVIYLSKIDPNFRWDRSKERDDDLKFRQMAQEGILEVLTQLKISFVDLPSTGRDSAIKALVAEIDAKMRE